MGVRGSDSRIRKGSEPRPYRRHSRWLMVQAVSLGLIDSSEVVWGSGFRGSPSSISTMSSLHSIRDGFGLGLGAHPAASPPCLRASGWQPGPPKATETERIQSPPRGTGSHPGGWGTPSTARQSEGRISPPRGQPQICRYPRGASRHPGGLGLNKLAGLGV